MQFVRDADPTALAPHAELFRKHVSDLPSDLHALSLLYLSLNQPRREGGREGEREHVSSVFRLNRQDSRSNTHTLRLDRLTAVRNKVQCY